MKKSQKLHFWKIKELSSHIRRQDSQSLRVPWQDPTTGLGISDFAKKKEKFLENFFWKIHKKRHISKTKKIWTVIFWGKIYNSLEYSDRIQLQGWELQILRNN